MEVLAIKQLKLLLDLLEEGVDIGPIIQTLSLGNRRHMLDVINEMKKEIEYD